MVGVRKSESGRTGRRVGMETGPETGPETGRESEEETGGDTARHTCGNTRWNTGRNTARNTGRKSAPTPGGDGADRAEHVVVAGGGVAGWMTACYLRAVCEGRFTVTVVAPAGSAREEDDESGLGDLGRFFDALGMTGERRLAECGATYKLAVRFEDFSRPGRHFYLPFERPPEADGHPLTDWWLRAGPGGRFDRDCFVTAWLCDAGRSPRDLDGRLPGPPAVPRYGYHLDGPALTRALTEEALRRGVRHIDDEVTGADLDGRGWIGSVRTAAGRAVHGDLFVDCTGARGLLLRGALRVPRVSYRDTVPTDGLVTLRVDADMRAHGVAPHTTVGARPAGWIWSIPLADRISTGHVYARDYSTPEEAERVLRAHAGPEAAGARAVHATLDPGRLRRAWEHNCVAVGAAAGLLPPLEATGISFVHHALERLAPALSAGWRRPGAGAELRAEYSAAVAGELDAAAESLSRLSRGAARQDTQFWRDVKTRPLPVATAGPPDGSGPPDAAGPSPGGPPGAAARPGLPAHAATSVLIGTGGPAPRPPAALDRADEAAARRVFAAVRSAARELVRSLPSQYDYLSRARA